MKWFWKMRTDHRAVPQDDPEHRLISRLSAIPATRWRVLPGGLRAVADTGETVELRYWQITTDDAGRSPYVLFIDGSRVPVDGEKLKSLYHAISTSAGTRVRAAV